MTRARQLLYLTANRELTPSAADESRNANESEYSDHDTSLSASADRNDHDGTCFCSLLRPFLRDKARVEVYRQAKTHQETGFKRASNWFTEIKPSAIDTSDQDRSYGSADECAGDPGYGGLPGLPGLRGAADNFANRPSLPSGGFSRSGFRAPRRATAPTGQPGGFVTARQMVGH